MFLLMWTAAEEAHHSAPLIDFDATFFVQAAIFLVLMGALTLFVFRPYLRLLRAQTEQTLGARSLAEQESESAAERMASYEQRVGAARRGAAEKRNQLRTQGQQKAEEKLAEARAKAEERLQEARSKLSSSVPATQLALRTRADELARIVASKVLGRGLGA